MTNTIDLSDRSGGGRVWVAAALWTAVAAIAAMILRAQLGLPFVNAFAGSLVNYYVLGALVWIVFAANERFSLWKLTPVQAVAVHVGLGLSAIALWATAQVGFFRLVIGPNYWQAVYVDSWMFQLLTAGMAYAASLGLGLTVQSVDRDRERQQREAQLEVAAREAELAAIKAQLQPHFLFNSLNSILALIEHDPGEARRMLIRLASLLHATFDRFDQPLVPLDLELDTIRDYLDIERIRFGDRLTFSIEAASDARAVNVPPFLLQPLVENAVKHGIEPYARPGVVRVSARLDRSHLHISVVDSGEGFDSSLPPAGRGRGLALTRRRLQAVYCDGAAEVAATRLPDGFSVALDLPVIAHAD